MLTQINGLHHVTSMAADAQTNNSFFTNTLGLRRVKKTVNFDAPDVYHLYYGDSDGTPGTVMTYFPFPHIAGGRAGAGEVGTTQFAVPEGALDFWQTHLAGKGVQGPKRETEFGENRLYFAGPDGDGFALVEQANDSRAPWTQSGIDADHAIRGFHGAAMRLQDDGAMGELLRFMNYDPVEKTADVVRYRVNGSGNGADFIDLEKTPNLAQARLGAGSVHHIAFSVDDR
ncbi:MAG: VOC family protein, partial [Pseudomonadota bacterium]